MRVRKTSQASIAGGPFMLRRGGPMTLRKISSTGPMTLRTGTGVRSGRSVPGGGRLRRSARTLEPRRPRRPLDASGAGRSRGDPGVSRRSRGSFLGGCFVAVTRSLSEKSRHDLVGDPRPGRVALGVTRSLRAKLLLRARIQGGPGDGGEHSFEAHAPSLPRNGDGVRACTLPPRHGAERAIWGPRVGRRRDGQEARGLSPHGAPGPRCVLGAWMVPWDFGLEAGRSGACEPPPTASSSTQPARTAYPHSLPDGGGQRPGGGGQVGPAQRARGSAAFPRRGAERRGGDRSLVQIRELRVGDGASAVSGRNVWIPRDRGAPGPSLATRLPPRLLSVNYPRPPRRRAKASAGRPLGAVARRGTSQDCAAMSTYGAVVGLDSAVMASGQRSGGMVQHSSSSDCRAHRWTFGLRFWPSTRRARWPPGMDRARTRAIWRPRSRLDRTRSDGSPPHDSLTVQRGARRMRRLRPGWLPPRQADGVSVGVASARDSGESAVACRDRRGSSHASSTEVQSHVVEESTPCPR